MDSRSPEEIKYQELLKQRLQDDQKRSQKANVLSGIASVIGLGVFAGVAIYNPESLNRFTGNFIFGITLIIILFINAQTSDAGDQIDLIQDFSVPVFGVTGIRHNPRSFWLMIFIFIAVLIFIFGIVVFDKIG